MDTKKLRQKILDLAIRGKLIPQDPNDEPASVLIEKIRVEKEQLIKEKKIKRDKNESYIYRSDKSYYEKFADGTTKCIDEEIPFGIPESWEWCRGYTCFLPMVSTKPTSEFFRYIDIESVDNKKHCITSPKVIRSNEAPSRASRKLSSGDTLFSMVRPYLENIAFIDDSYADCIASTGFYVCKPNEFLFSEYSFRLMTSLYVIKGLNQYMKGDNSPSINNDNILSWLYPIPPFSEQQKIVSSIKKYNSLINELEANKADLEEFVAQTKSKILDLAIRGKLVPQDPSDEPASVLLERIKTEHSVSKKTTKKTSDNSHYENLPQGWAKCTLENVGSWSAGSTPSRSNKMYYENGTVNWLKTGDLNDGYIDYIPEKITDLALKECSVRLNPKDSVLIAMYGGTIGKIGILNIPATTNQACCACITYPGIYNKFLFYLLMSKKRILQMKGEGGAQPNISKDKIINFPILLPPSLEQKRIVQTIENLFQQLDNIISGL